MFYLLGRGFFRRRDERPNVLFISVDTLRADHVGFFGAAVPATPEIDRFAGRSFVFPAAYAPRGETAPSLTSALTGLYPTGHGVFDNHCIFRENIDTLTAALKRAGYRTAAIIANKALSYCKLVRDFDRSLFTADEDRADWKDDEEAVRAAIEYLSDPPGEPFFLWVHLMDPHSPYEPSPEDRGVFVQGAEGIDGSRETLNRITRGERPLTAAVKRVVRGLYDEEIRGTDRRVGKLLRALKKTGGEKNTIVVFFSDHGEELGEHHRYFFHQASVYRQVLHVPMIWRLPEKVLERTRRTSKLRSPRRAGLLFSRPVSLVDVAPTAAAVLGVRLRNPTDGIDLSPLFRGEEIPRTRVFSEYADKIYGVLTERYHYIHNPRNFAPYGEPFPSPEERRADPDLRRLPRFTVKSRELYDILEDPLEQDELSELETGTCRRLEKEIRGYLAGRKPLEPLRVTGEAALAELSRLGYVAGSNGKAKKTGKKEEKKEARKKGKEGG